MTDQKALVRLENVSKFFMVPRGLIAGLRDKGEKPAVRAVDDVSFEIMRGEVLGLAGESGSGKSTVGRLVLRLLDPTAGRVFFDGVDLATLKPEEMRKTRSRMQVVFQDPLASLNPRMSIGKAVEHPAQIHMPELTAKQRRDEVYEIFSAVGLDPPKYFYDKYPHQISGGQRQRVVMARGLITRPDLIVADEPIAMADVSVQALLLDLMLRLKEDFDLTYLFITHDLATTKYLCDRLAIMYLGKIVEVGSLREVFPTRSTRIRGPSCRQFPYRIRGIAGRNHCQRVRSRTRSTRLRAVITILGARSRSKESAMSRCWRSCRSRAIPRVWSRAISGPAPTRSSIQIGKSLRRTGHGVE